MKHFSRIIVLVGGFIAFISFATPWHVYIGLEYVQDGVILPATVFVASLLLIAVSMHRLTEPTTRKFRRRVSIISFIGIGCVLLLMTFVNPNGIPVEFDHRANKYGIFLTFIGFLIVLIGVRINPKHRDNTESKNE